MAARGWGGLPRKDLAQARLGAALGGLNLPRLDWGADSVSGGSRNKGVMGGGQLRCMRRVAPHTLVQDQLREDRRRGPVMKIGGK